MRMQRVNRFVLLTVLLASGISCGDVVRQGRSPMLLVIDRLEASRGPDGEFAGTLFSDVLTIVTEPAPCTEDNPCAVTFGDSGRVTLRLVPKDLGSPTAPTVPTSNNDVTINRYHVNYKRADGRNAPGVDVPYPFDGSVTGTVPSSGTASFAFQLVRIVAKHEAPLVQLQDSPVFLDVIADLTFYGQDRVGNDISITGSLLIEFGNFGD